MTEEEYKDGYYVYQVRDLTQPYCLSATESFNTAHPNKEEANDWIEKNGKIGINYVVLGVFTPQPYNPLIQ